MSLAIDTPDAPTRTCPSNTSVVPEPATPTSSAPSPRRAVRSTVVLQADAEHDPVIATVFHADGTVKREATHALRQHRRSTSRSRLMGGHRTVAGRRVARKRLVGGSTATPTSSGSELPSPTAGSECELIRQQAAY